MPGCVAAVQVKVWADRYWLIVDIKKGLSILDSPFYYGGEAGI